MQLLAQRIRRILRWDSSLWTGDCRVDPDCMLSGVMAPVGLRRAVSST